METMPRKKQRPAAHAPVPADATQTWTPAAGLASLEAARGDDHVTINGTTLKGEITFNGTTWDPDTWTQTSPAGSSWTGSSWSGSSWTGSSWTGNSWTGSSWTGSSWRRTAVGSQRNEKALTLHQVRASSGHSERSAV